MPNSTDFTFRTDMTGAMIESKRGEYVCNVIQLLFSMVPGTDEYEPERGLNVMNRYRTCYSEGSRDSEFESMITEQLTKYTDFIPMNLIAMYTSKVLYVYLAIRYEEAIYEVDLNADTDNLSAILRNNS